jgi:chondroitin 4-sulfotransferase 11
MISHKHKFIFLEYSKTGTTTIEEGLEKYCETKTNHKTDSFYWKHARPKTIKELFEKENKKDEWKNYFKFTFTRNPFDRMVSLWNYMHKSLEMYKNKCEEEGLDWKPDHYHWIENCQKVTSKCKTFKEYVKYTAYGSLGINSVFAYAFDEDEKFVDFIGRFENLQEDFDIVCDKIGIPQQQLPHKNKTKHKHYTVYYDDETREIVAKKYAKDIEHFGYKFGE